MRGSPRSTERSLAGVNDRLGLVAELKGEKAARGVAFVDPEQERRVVDALVRANAGPLSDEGVRELVDVGARAHEARARADLATSYSSSSSTPAAKSSGVTVSRKARNSTGSTSPSADTRRMRSSFAASSSLSNSIPDSSITSSAA